MLRLKIGPAYVVPEQFYTHCQKSESLTRVTQRDLNNAT